MEKIIFKKSTKKDLINSKKIKPKKDLTSLKYQKCFNSFLFKFSIILTIIIIPVSLTNIINIKLINVNIPLNKFINVNKYESEIINNSSGSIITINVMNSLTTCEDMFNLNNSYIESIDLSNFDTTNVQSMKNMFFNQTKLKTIIFGNIQTSKVKNMSGMFQNCKSLISLNLSNFDFSGITDMTNMFSGCESLQSVKFPINKPNLFFMNTNYMFNNCTSLKTLDLSNFNFLKKMIL